MAKMEVLEVVLVVPEVVLAVLELVLVVLGAVRMVPVVVCVVPGVVLVGQGAFLHNIAGHFGPPWGDLELLGRQSFNTKGRKQQQRSKNNKAKTENNKT